MKFRNEASLDEGWGDWPGRAAGWSRQSCQGLHPVRGSQQPSKRGLPCGPQPVDAALRSCMSCCLHLPAPQLLCEVYLPLLSQQAGAEATSAALSTAGAAARPGAAAAGAAAVGSAAAAAAADGTQRDLLGSMQKFAGQLSQALQQLTGEVTLQVGVCERACERVGAVSNRGLMEASATARLCAGEKGGQGFRGQRCSGGCAQAPLRRSSPSACIPP